MALRITGSVIGEPITSSSSSATGMWLSQEVAALQQDGIWQIAPGFTLTSSAATVNEGASITITLTTTGITNGTAVPYVISGANIFANDSANGVITGNFVIQNNSNTISFAANADLLTEGSETFTITAGGVSTAVTINDTSTTPVSSDAQFPYTTLALHGNGTNNSQNNTFLDSSTNNFSITRNGNSTQGTFSPYGGNWSNYFNGSSYLTVPAGTAFAPGTGDFTVEGWFNASDLMTSASGIIYGQAVSGTNYFMIFATNGVVQFYGTSSGGGSAITSGANNWTLGTWNHFAVVRTSGSVTVYLNGIAGTAANNTTNFNDTSYIPTIGRYTHTGTNFFYGYISNLRYVKGTAVYTSNFTPSTTPLTAIAGTSLLTCQDNRIIDDSPNNFTITKNGDVSVQRFSPFSPVITTPTTYSGYFAANEQLTSASIGTSIGTGDFSMECWVYVPNAANGYAAAIQLNVSTGVNLYIQTHFNTLRVLDYNNPNGSNFVLSGGTINNSTWYHLLLTRQSGTVRGFINGNLTVNQTGVTYNYGTAGTCQINAGLYASTISNARVVIGNVPTEYQTSSTTNGTQIFTPSTTPLTAVSSTSLLTCQSATFIDNSTNALTFTITGSPKPTQQNPFGFTNTSSEYSTTTFGGSAYFDGTGDYLVTPASSALALATNAADFTIECWVYNNGGAGSQYGRGICVYYPSGGYGTNRLMFRLIAGGDRINVYLLANSSAEFGGSGTDGTATITIGAWTHVALVRKTGVFYVYVNGVLDITVSSSSSASSIPFTTFNTIEVGRTQDGASPDWFGNISNYRFVKGTAVYTSNFVPPTAPVTAVANTQLLCNFTNAGIIDNAMMVNLETVGDAKISTTQSKFGGTSMYFDGTGDYLISPYSESYQLGTGDFTIEFWINASASGSYNQVVGTNNVDLDAGAWRVGNRFNSANQVYFARGTGGGVNEFTASVNVNDGSWHHVAVVRNSGTVTIYVDGTSSASSSITGTCSSSNQMRIGYNPRDNSYVTGYIDDLRITKGYARYTSNFTPPTEFANK
jgi:hypothetical protein